MKLVNLEPRLPGAIFDIRYATSNNITGQPIYFGNVPRLDEPAGEALKRANKLVAVKALRLVIFDAYRPIEAHKQLLDVENDPNYVLSVEDSGHPKGTAVDATLASSEGEYLDMGTDFDHFGTKAHIDAKGLTSLQIINRSLIAGLMAGAGFVQWPYEWWHFDFKPHANR